MEGAGFEPVLADWPALAHAATLVWLRGLGERPAPEPCVECGIGSTGGQGCCPRGVICWQPWGLTCDVARIGVMCHGQMAVVRDIQGVGPLVSGVGLTGAR